MINKTDIGDSNPILTKPLADILLSPEFMEMARVNHFTNLNEIIKHPTYVLLKCPMFGYRMLIELSTVLKSYGLENLLIED